MSACMPHWHESELTGESSVDSKRLPLRCIRSYANGWNTRHLAKTMSPTWIWFKKNTIELRTSSFWSRLRTSPATIKLGIYQVIFKSHMKFSRLTNACRGRSMDRWPFIFIKVDADIARWLIQNGNQSEHKSTKFSINFKVRLTIYREFTISQDIL